MGVCDFSWALAQMNEGKAMRRDSWMPGNYISKVQTADIVVILLKRDGLSLKVWNPRQDDIVAEDWALAQ